MALFACLSIVETAAVSRADSTTSLSTKRSGKGATLAGGARRRTLRGMLISRSPQRDI
jgi:hypothetical protein